MVNPIPARHPTPAICFQLTLRGSSAKPILTLSTHARNIPTGLPSTSPATTPSVTATLTLSIGETSTYQAGSVSTNFTWT